MAFSSYLTLRSSQLAALNSVNFTGSTITAGSTINTTTLFYSTMLGSTITVSTLSGSTLSGSTMAVSSITASGLVLSTLTGSTITVSTLIGSTLSGSTMVISSIIASGLVLSTITVSSINNAVPGTGAGVSAFSTLTVSSIVSVSSIQTASTMYASSMITTGSVGIGTATPAFGLSVKNTQAIYGTGALGSTAATGGNLLFYTSGDTYTYPTLNLFQYDHNNCGILFDMYFGAGWFNATTGTGYGIHKNSDILQFTYMTGTAGTVGSLKTAMTINSSGYLGIGMTNPHDVLHTMSPSTSVIRIGASTSISSVSQLVFDQAISGYWHGSGYGNNPTTGARGAAYGAAMIQSGNESGNNYENSYMTFHTCRDPQSDGMGGLGVLYERMRINSLGYVGIGTTAPSQKLDVSSDGARIQVESNTANNAVVQIKTNANTSYLFTDQSGHLQIYPASTSKHVLLQPSGGNVGIGTTNPLSPLMIQSPAIAVGGSVRGQIIIQTAEATPITRVSLGYDTSYNYLQGWNSLPLSINPLGNNVGIGITNPTSLLHVAGAINCTSFLVNGVAVATGTGSVWGVSGSTAYYTSGNVGIGTTAPITNLHVRVTPYATPIFIVDAGNQGVDSISVPRGIGKPLIGVGAYSWSNISSGDYYGIGFGYNANNTSGNYYPAEIGFLVQTTAGGEYGDMVFSTRATTTGTTIASERMRITSSGNVGIGTTAPTSVLTINNTGAYQTHHLIIRGQEFYASGNSTTGIALNIGVNRAGNKQLWIMDPDLAINTTNGCFRIIPGSNNTLNSVSTDGTINLPLTISGSSISLTGGNVGIGTGTPNFQLHLYKDSPGILFTSSSYTSNPWYLFVGTSNGAMYLGPNINTGTPGCNVAIGASAWAATSDLRLKKSITPLPSALDNILQLNPILFQYKTDSDSETLREGFIAQEVRSIFPSKWIVSETGMPEKQVDDNGELYDALSVSSTQLIPHLVKSIQELSQTVTSSVSQIQELSQTVTSSASQIQELSQTVTSSVSQIQELSSQNTKLQAQLDAVLTRLSAAGI